MPIYYEIVDNTYIILRGEDVVSGSEIVKKNALLYTKPEYKNVAGFQLWDLTALTNVKMSAREHMEAAQQDKDALSSYSQIFVAIAGTADQVFGISRTYAGYAPDGVTTMAFRSRTEAEEWILKQLEHNKANAGL